MRSNSSPRRHVILPAPGHSIQLPSGETLQIGRKLGSGHFGIVHEAVDDFENAVVVKTLSPKAGTYDEVKENWEREFNALSLLRHPHITHVHNWFEHNNAFSIVIERCSDTIESLFAMPGYNGYAWARPIARCLLSGIHFIHSQGYVHKDIHLGNVFWMIHRNEMAPMMASTPNPSVTFKIGDLGISRLATEIDFFGTVLAQWMLPPEFLNPAQYGFVGPQTDIYHVGLLLLSVLQGHSVKFDRSAILNGDPRTMAEALPAPWGFALEKALRRTVIHRTQSALEFWHDLQ